MRFGEWVITPSDSRPREVVLELSTSCNLRCKHCFRNALGIEARYAPKGLVEALLEECAKVGVERILLSGWGEPTTYPWFLDVVWKARELGLEIAVNTNGHFLGEVARDLVEAGVSEVIVSLDAFSEELYEEIRGAPLHRVLEGLEALRGERAARGSRVPRVVVHFVVTKKNVNELEKFPEFAKKFSVSSIEISHLIPLNPAMERSLACFSSPSCVARLERLCEEISKYMFSHYYEVKIPRNKPSIERKCPYATNLATYVTVDGYVAPCMFYAHRSTYSFDEIEREINPVYFGNVEEGLLNVWRNPKYVEFRARAALSLMPSCLDCPLARYCEPTRSNEKDCWGNSPTCSHCPFSHRVAVCPL